MPGVVVTTAVRTGPTTVNVAPASTFFVVGESQRGPTDEARLVNSLAEFEARYGDYIATGTLHQQVQTFFEEGGARAYVARVVGSGATAATLTLNASGGGSALTLTAANVGTWANNLTGLSVTTETVGSGIALKLYLNESLLFSTGEQANVANIVSAINDSSTAEVYMTATATNASATLGASATAQVFTGGTNDAADSSEYIDGLDLFLNQYGAGAVAIPGQYGDTVWSAIETHCVANNRIGLLAFDPANTVTNSIDDADGWITSEAVNPEYVGFYYPSVTMTGSAQTSLTISPEGYVAAKRSIAHNTTGAWGAAAGVQSKAQFITGTAVSVDKNDGDDLDDANINAIRVIQNSVRIYGARSASTDTTNFRYITARDTLNYIVVEAERRLEDLVFSPIDGRRTVFGRVEARLIGLLDPIRTAGGLFEAFDTEGNQVDAGYSVQVTDDLNPITQLATGVVKAKVGVRISSIADRIEIEIVKSNLTTSVV